MDRIGAAVWATGHAARVIVEAGLTRPWLESRGGIVYSAAREGLDLGEACGLDVRLGRSAGAPIAVGQSDPRSNQIRSPVNRSVTGSHGKRIRTSSETASPDGGDARPGSPVGAGQRRHLERALRPDDDLGQREGVVREGREQLRVEGPRARVALPALARRDDLVDAVRRPGSR